MRNWQASLSPAAHTVMASVRPLPHPSWSPIHNNNLPLASKLILRRGGNMSAARPNGSITVLLTFRTSTVTPGLVWNLVFAPLVEILRPSVQWSPHAVQLSRVCFVFLLPDGFLESAWLPEHVVRRGTNGSRARGWLTTSVQHWNKVLKYCKMVKYWGQESQGIYFTCFTPNTRKKVSVTIIQSITCDNVQGNYFYASSSNNYHIENKILWKKKKSKRIE